LNIKEGIESLIVSFQDDSDGELTEFGMDWFHEISMEQTMIHVEKENERVRKWKAEAELPTGSHILKKIKISGLRTLLVRLGKGDGKESETSAHKKISDYVGEAFETQDESSFLDLLTANRDIIDFKAPHIHWTPILHQN